MDGHHQAALNALVLGLGLPPLLAWGGSALALVGRPSGGKAVFGLGSCLVAALASAFFAYGFQLDGTATKVFIVGATLLLVIAHAFRYHSARKANRPAESGSPTTGSRLRKLWRYL
jgi:hypothetical protein